MKTVETLLVELQDELHYSQYPSETKVKIFKEEHLKGDYFPLHMVKTVAERYANQQATPPPTKGEGSEWISVKDRLPDTDDKWFESDILQVIDDMENQTTAFYNSKRHEWIVAHHRASNEPINVEYYQPLPTPPNQ